MIRLITLSLLIMFAFTFVGCKTHVPFPRGARYGTPYVVNESVIVTFPDEIQDRQIRLKLGGWIDRKTFVIPLFEAYTTETGARMKGLFSKSVTMTLNSVVEEMLPELQEKSREAERREQSGGTDTARELDALLDGLDGDDPDSEEKEMTDEEWVESEMLKASKETLIEEKPSYWLKFDEALLGFPNNQATVSFRVKLIDQRTGAEILHKRYRGRSQVFEPYQSDKTNKDVIVRLTKQAFSGPMQQLVTDIAERTGGRR